MLWIGMEYKLVGVCKLALLAYAYAVFFFQGIWTKICGREGQVRIQWDSRWDRMGLG